MLPSILLLISLFVAHPYETEDKQTFTLLFAGDAMLHQSQIDNAYRNGEYDFSSYFHYIEPEVSAADLAFVNLEVTLGGKPYKGYPQFSAPDEYAVALQDAGFDVFLTANNHILDRRNKGLVRTLSVLDSLNVIHTGSFRDKADRENRYPLIIEKQGIRFAVLNVTYSTNGIEPQNPVVVNYIDRVQITADINKAKEQEPDIIIAAVHWGEEYRLIQNKTQESLAQFLTDQGVDLVIGSHPHVVQPSLLVSNEAGEAKHLVVYSLGNLVSGMKAVNTDGGQLIKVILEKDGDEVRIKSAGYQLVYVHKQQNEKKIDYQVIPVSLAENITYPIVDESISLPEEALLKMNVFTKNARSVLNKHNNGVSEYKMLPKSRIDAPNYSNKFW